MTNTPDDDAARRADAAYSRILEATCGDPGPSKKRWPMLRAGAASMLVPSRRWPRRACAQAQLNKIPPIRRVAPSSTTAVRCPTPLRKAEARTPAVNGMNATLISSSVFANISVRPMAVMWMNVVWRLAQISPMIRNLIAYPR